MGIEFSSKKLLRYAIVLYGLNLMYWMKRRSSITDTETKVDFPWFLIGFIIMSLVGSYLSNGDPQLSASIMGGIGTLSTFILTMAMVGLGLNVSFQAIRTKALRPLIAMTITSILLSVITFFSI